MFCLVQLIASRVFFTPGRPVLAGPGMVAEGGLELDLVGGSRNSSAARLGRYPKWQPQPSVADVRGQSSLGRGCAFRLTQHLASLGQGKGTRHRYRSLAWLLQVRAITLGANFPVASPLFPLDAQWPLSSGRSWFLPKCCAVYPDFSRYRSGVE